MIIVPSTYWGGERNRCTITTPNGLQVLSVPVYDSRKQQPIDDVRICYMHSWQRQHWSAIFSAYGKTPYFDYYADYIRPIYQVKHEFLVDLNNKTAYVLSCLLHNERPNLLNREKLTDDLWANRGQTFCHPHLLDILFEYGPEGLTKI